MVIKKDFDQNPDLQLLKLFGFTHQLGIEIVNKEGKRVEPFVITPKEVALILKTESNLLTITGIAELVKELREHILELKYLKDPQEDDTKADIDIISKNTTLLFNEKKTILNKYIKTKVRINILLKAIDEVLNERSLDKDEIKEYRTIKLQLENWQSILKEVLSSLGKDSNLDRLIEEEEKRQRIANLKDENENQQTEVSRLIKLLTGEREVSVKKQQGLKEKIIEMLKGKFKKENNKQRLRKRVIKVLAGNTLRQKGKQLSNDIYKELWEVASVVNDIRIIERFKLASINLLAIKKNITKIKKDYEEKLKEVSTFQDEEKLNEEYNNKIINLLIPIANKTAMLFKHENDNSPTTIARVLYQSKAVCAGKAEVLTSIFQMFGLRANSIFVIKTLNNTSDHAVVKVSLFGNQELTIDANYSNSDGGNVLYINSNVLVYLSRATNLKNIPDAINSYFTVLTENGEKVIYKANVKYPHKVVIENEFNRMSASAHNNYANLIINNWQKLGIESLEKAVKLAQKHYLKAIENKHDSLYVWYLTSYADFLDNFADNKEDALVKYKEVLELMESNSKVKNWLTIEEVKKRIERLNV